MGAWASYIAAVTPSAAGIVLAQPSFSASASRNSLTVAVSHPRSGLFSRDFEHHYGPAAAAAPAAQWAAAYRQRHAVQRRWRRGEPTRSKELKSHNGVRDRGR